MKTTIESGVRSITLDDGSLWTEGDALIAATEYAQIAYDNLLTSLAAKGADTSNMPPKIPNALLKEYQEQRMAGWNPGGGSESC